MASGSCSENPLHSHLVFRPSNICQEVQKEVRWVNKAQDFKSTEYDDSLGRKGGWYMREEAKERNGSRCVGRQGRSGDQEDIWWADGEW